MFTLNKLTMKTLLLILFPFLSFGQYVTTWPELQAMKQANQLIVGQVYLMTDLGKLEIMAKSTNSFHEVPYRRSRYALDYDEELFDFDNKIITGIDNVAGVARCTNSVWYLLNDAGHRPYKLSHCSNNLMVHYGKTYDKVVSASTVLDETYSGSQLNITCGASVGLSYITIFMHKNVNGVKSQMTLQESSIVGSNLFIFVKLIKFIQL